MAFKEAKETMGTMLRWTEKAKDDKQRDSTIYLGDSVTGFYIGKKDGVGQNNSTVYDIKLADDRVVSIWGSGLLDGKFAEIPVGCEVRVTYLGIAQPKKSSGRAYQNFKVEFDPSSRTPMKTAGAAVAATPAPSTAPEGSAARANDDFDNVGNENNTSAGDGY